MFHANVPATEGQFFDRHAELARLEKLVEDLAAGPARWLAILGPRKIGKTSLLFEVARRSKNAQVRFVLLDAMAEAPLTLGFFRWYALRAVDACLGTALGASLDVLSMRPADYRGALIASDAMAALPPALRRTVIELAEMEMNKAAVRACLDLPERLAEALDLRLVVAIDEFQELDVLRTKRGAFDPFPVMRSSWQAHRRIAYVISGSGRSMLTAMIADKGAPFFQHFSMMEVGPFPLAEAKRLLLELSEEGRAIPPEIADQALSILGGHPFYLQLFGETLTLDPPPYDGGSVKAAMQRLLFSRTGSLSLYFQNEFERLVGQAALLAGTLESLAEGPARVTDLARRLHLPTGTAVRCLERLGDAVMRQGDGRYALEDGVFGLWLRWRRPGGTVVPMTILGDEAEKRVADHLARMGFELVYQSRASRGAFDLLAIGDGRHLGVQVKGSGLPLRFDTATWARMQADAKRLGWAWIVAAVDVSAERDAGSGAVHILDPARARRRREVRLDEAAVIENLREWILR